MIRAAVVAIAVLAVACGGGSAPTVRSVAVVATRPTLAAGTSEQLTAIAVLSDYTTMDVTAQAAWISSTTSTTVAGGLVVTDVPGPVNISATFDGATGSATIDVTAATLQSITIVPTTTSVASGLTDVVLAIGAFSDGTTQDLSTKAVWECADPGVASIAGGILTAKAPGDATITAGLGATVSDHTVIHVSAAMVVSIEVDPIVGLIRSRGHSTRGGYDGEDGCEGRPREARAATVHG